MENGIAAAHDEAREASASAAAEVPRPTTGGRGGRTKKVERRGRPPGKAKPIKGGGTNVIFFTWEDFELSVFITFSHFEFSRIAEGNDQVVVPSSVEGLNGLNKKETDIKDERGMSGCVCHAIVFAGMEPCSNFNFY